MKKLKLATMLLFLTNISHVFAKDIMFISTNNTPLTQNKSTNVGFSYGLSDDEIAKRVEMGLADTVPISALKKWQEKKKLENIKSTNTVNHTQYIQHNNIQYIPNIPNVSTDYQSLNTSVVLSQNNEMDTKISPKTEFQHNTNIHIQNEQDAQRHATVEFGVLPLPKINTEHTDGETQYTN